MKGGDKMILKSNLKYFRKSKKFDLTQVQLAAKIGVTPMTIYKIENGKGANLKTLKKLSDLFEVSINELFDFKEEE